MRESRADRDSGRSGGDHQQQSACQHRDARGADGAAPLDHHGSGADQQQAGGRGSRQADQVGGGPGAGRGREAGVQVRHGVSPGPPGVQLRGGQEGHAEDELPSADPPADVPPQRFRRSDEEPDHESTGHQPRRYQHAADHQPRLHPGQAQHHPQPGSLRARGDAGVDHRAPAAWDSSR
jgi:hypothetical protein